MHCKYGGITCGGFPCAWWSRCTRSLPHLRRTYSGRAGAPDKSARHSLSAQKDDFTVGSLRSRSPVVFAEAPAARLQNTVDIVHCQNYTLAFRAVCSVAQLINAMAAQPLEQPAVYSLPQSAENIVDGLSRQLLDRRFHLAFSRECKGFLHVQARAYNRAADGVSA